jgi:hypothetical protein
MKFYKSDEAAKKKCGKIFQPTRHGKPKDRQPIN